MAFKKGQSGNPKGKPKGLISKQTELKHLLEENGRELILKAIQMAKEGNKDMMRLCIERLLPKAVETTFAASSNQNSIVIIPDNGRGSEDVSSAD